MHHLASTRLGDAILIKSLDRQARKVDCVISLILYAIPIFIEPDETIDFRKFVQPGVEVNVVDALVQRSEGSLLSVDGV